MNLILNAPVWLLACIFALLAAAAVEDAWRLRISNLTCLAVLILAVVAAALQGFSADLWQNFAIFAGLLMIGTFAFSIGALGGGDVKLLAALGLWLDWRGTLLLLAAVFIAGGILALLYIAGRMLWAGQRARDRHGRNIPYGIAIAAGALISFTATRAEQRRIDIGVFRRPVAAAAIVNTGADVATDSTAVRFTARELPDVHNRA